MANIQEIEKEIVQLQENIEAALNELSRPRGQLAKYAKLCQFENGLKFYKTKYNLTKQLLIIY